MKTTAQGSACGDCLVLLANGETPVDMNEDETEAWLKEIARRSGDLHVVVGGEHEDDCPNMEDGEWAGSTDCSCEDLGFSSSPCDVCGSHFGGDRYAVTYLGE